MQRAYAIFDIKSLDEEERIVKGIATTPETDHMGDIVESTGARFKLPLPLLWQHDKEQPIGWVKAAKVSASGIEIEAHIPKGVTDKIEEAWALIKAGLVRGLSIGFSPKAEHIEHLKGGGMRFKEWHWHELSAVTIPANAGASISVVRSIDQAALSAQLNEELIRFPSPTASVIRGFAASGEPPVVSGKPIQLISKGIPVKTITEQIKDLKETRAQRAAVANEIMQKSADAGRSTEDDEAASVDEALAVVKRLDLDIGRLEQLEVLNVSKATQIIVPADGTNAVEVRGGASIKVDGEKLPPGIEFARFVKCLAAANGNLDTALNVAKHRYPDSARLQNVFEMAKSEGSMYGFQEVLKANVLAGTTTGTTWAAPLVQYQQFAGDFLEFLRPQTIIGKFGTNGIPSLQQVPFNVTIGAETAGGDAQWVGEGKPKPLTSFEYGSTNLRWAKVAAITVLTEELIRFSSPSAEARVRNSLAKAVIARIDRDFVDPTKAAVANVSPASITNGATSSASAGGTEANVRTDITTLFNAYVTNNLSPTDAVWIMRSTLALQLSLMVNSFGSPAFPGITLTGGTFMGLPVIVSDYVATATAGGQLILVNASEIYLADDGQVVVDVSREASLQMLDNPTVDSVTPTPTTLVSMFQTNSVAIRAERWINWARRRPAAVVYLTGVNYDGT